MNAPKARRHREILALIADGPVHTHDDLASALAARGISASQGTLSRDLRELGVVKTPAGYALTARPQIAQEADAELAGAIAQFLVDVRTAQHLVVLRTRPGSASALAQFLDAARWPDIVGTIAGDDTIFAATQDPPTAVAVLQRLESL